jgi:hypothetical protein
MNRIAVILALLATTGMAACSTQEGKKMSQNEINAKVDSIVGARIEELNNQAVEDLDRRMSIEVKAKADSIVQAYEQSQQPAANPQ